VHATRRAAEVIAALPAASWPAQLTDMVVRTGIAPEIALSEVLNAVQPVPREPIDVRQQTRLGQCSPESQTEGRAVPGNATSGPTTEFGTGAEFETLGDSAQQAQHAAGRRPLLLRPQERLRQRL
jgi:hypothetical protein